jgi:hypothetical protein
MKRLYISLGAAALVVGALFLTACLHSNGRAPAAAPSSAASGRLTVLVTGTTWANLEPCG